MIKTCVIMAGGSGERFWPLSRKDRPKQLLNLDSKLKTMLRQSIDRIGKVIDKDKIIIITSINLLEPIRKELADIPPSNVIAEPSKRNTAPCLAYAAAFLKARYQIDNAEILMAVLTADHKIETDEIFQINITAILDFVANNQGLCTIGIKPSRPETGYGYIEAESKFDIPGTTQIVPVARFHEKPDIAKASQYIESGNFFWNSGMFFWRLDVFINEMKCHFPEVGEQIDAMAELHSGNTEKAYTGTNEKIIELYNSFPDKSIDYALMEKSTSVFVAKADFTWDDIGSWDSFSRLHGTDAEGNLIFGDNIVSVDSKNTMVINNSGDTRMVSALGLEDIIVITTDDSVLVCHKSKVQDVKKIVAELRNKKMDKWL
ncbi:MAG: mannose-1-phosphate guanylyltransferase [Desulfobulbaceae bacterium]|nr:mannose-1-phosphate guanylyltransferase [Candidatus Kapabacteria bacterium]MBS3999883.1 mannose-1-phosphate guanylyltransferase [Desulfobulbaceae bacterium]